MEKIYVVYFGDEYDNFSCGYFKNKVDAKNLIKSLKKEEPGDEYSNYWIKEENVFENVNEWKKEDVD